MFHYLITIAQTIKFYTKTFT